MPELASRTTETGPLRSGFFGAFRSKADTGLQRPGYDFKPRGLGRAAPINVSLTISRHTAQAALYAC